MELFIGNLPQHAVVSELQQFFRGFGRTAHFRILEKVLDNGEALRFGHGVIEPDWAATHALRRLNHKRLHGCRLEIRPYVHRAAEGDRRSGDRPERRVEGKIRRVSERRSGGRFRPVPNSWR